MGGETIMVARGGRILTPPFDPLVPRLTECRYFPGSHWLSRLPVCMERLEIGWRFSDRLGVACFWFDMQCHYLGDDYFWRIPVGTWRRFFDLFIDPTADFILSNHSIGVWKGDKAVNRGNACVIR